MNEKIEKLTQKLEKQMDHYLASVEEYAEKHKDAEPLLKQVRKDKKTVDKIMKVVQ